jgi:EmrB/QacA subfamily drug resistance transporter
VTRATTPEGAEEAGTVARPPIDSTAALAATGLADEQAVNPRRWLALAVIAVAQLMVVLDASIVNIALPSAQRDLGISDADRQWVVTAYMLAFGGLLLLGGRIADFVGRKRTFIIGLLGFAGASALGGIAGSAGMLFAARGLQGAFGALLAPSALSLITVTFTEPRERARAFGVFGAIAGGGAAIGLILGGVLTEYASWRWCLGVNVPIAVLTAIVAVPIVRESRAHGDTSLDVPGALLATGGLALLVYGFTEAARPGVGWGSGRTLGLLAGAVVLLAGFVLLESRLRHPLLPLRIALDRNRGGAYLTFLLVGAGLFAMFLFLVFYFQAVLGYSALKSGFAFLPFSGGIIVTAGLVSQILPRTGPKPLMVGGLLMATIGMIYLIMITPTTSYAAHVLPSEILLSVGLAAVFVPASSTALVGVDPHDAGVASALLNTTQQVGGSLGTALLNTLYASAVTAYIADHVAGASNPRVLQADALVHGYHVAFVWAAVLLGLAMLVSITFINAKRDDIPATPGGVPAA